MPLRAFLPWEVGREWLSCGDSPALAWDNPLVATGGCGGWTSVATKLVWCLLMLYLSREGEFGLLGCP